MLSLKIRKLSKDKAVQYTMNRLNLPCKSIVSSKKSWATRTKGPLDLGATKRLGKVCDNVTITKVDHR